MSARRWCFGAATLLGTSTVRLALGVGSLNGLRLAHSIVLLAAGTSLAVIIFLLDSDLTIDGESSVGNRFVLLISIASGLAV